MEKLKSMPFQINNLIENSISHIETSATVPAGQAPRGMYFEIHHYEEACWYIKNHYSDPNLIHGSSTITATNNFGELLDRKPLNHLIFRIKKATGSGHFVALTFNLRLNYYSPHSQNIAARDISKNIQNRYDIQCVDLSENGENVFYSKSNLIYRLDNNLNQIQSWKIPAKFTRENKATTPEIQQAFLTLGLSGKPKADDIKLAFRKNLVKVHPDINPSDPLASDKTRKVIEAYEVLTRGFVNQTDNTSKKTFGVIEIDFKFEGDGVSATQIKKGSDGLYVGCYSGKVYLLFPDGKYDLVYDCHAPVRKINESGKYLYIISDHFWDILLGRKSVNRISGMFRFDRILIEKSCNAEILNRKKIRLYSLGGIAFGEVAFKDNIADAFLIDNKLRVITGKKSFLFDIRIPVNYQLIAVDNHFLQ